MPATSTLSLLRAYAALAWKNQQSSGGQAEERLKAPVGALVGDFGQEVLGLAANTAAEYRCDSLPGRPDIGVEVDALPVGFVELKAPGKGAKVAAFKDKHDKDQWAKLRDTPNVLYTDGIEWGLYQLGECKLLIRLPDNVLQVGPEAITASHGAEIENLLRQFYGHEAVVPSSAPQLAVVLAPLCRLLRDAVLAAVQRPESPLAQQAKDWRALLFSDADDHQFADSYAQTVTYGLLLARLTVKGRLDCRTAAKALEDSHGLLGRALKTLTDDDVEVPIQYPLRLLERAIGAVQPHKLYKAGTDPWLYFYEQFLEAYDRKLRNDRGVYYTPTEAVRAMVRLTEECLRADLGLAGYADDSVVVLDPATGTGTFPLAIVDQAIDGLAKYGAVTAPAATSLARRLFGFEIMVGPYAVANMRVAQALVDAGGKLPQEGVGLMLGDTLESPYDGTLAHVGSFYARLASEHERVRKVKRSQKVLVCIGNPPYDRQQIDPDDALQKRKGGWVRHQPRNPEMLQSKPLLDDFLEPARQAGKGGHLKNIYNDYAYFWRWAMWKVLEQNDGPGVVCFITASSYLRGPGFVGMRQLMRQQFDELWILDLQGDNLGARKTENIFNIQTPVCIALGVRRAGGDKKTAAKVWYKVVTGSRAEKLTYLDHLQSRTELDWQLCMDGWQDPMLPQGKSDFFSWPYLTDLFPWQQSGVKAICANLRCLTSNSSLLDCEHGRKDSTRISVAVPPEPRRRSRTT